MRLAVYLGLLADSERTLAESLRTVSDVHADEPDVHFLCRTLASRCDAHAEALGPVVARYGESGPDDEPERLAADGLGEGRSGPLGLLRDLQDLATLTSFVHTTWTLVGQAARGLRDEELDALASRAGGQLSTQIDWLQSRMKQAAPQALIVA